MRGKLFVTFAAFVLLTVGLPAQAHDTGSPHFHDLPTAFDEAKDGDVLVLHASNLTEQPFRASLTIDKEVDLCAGGAVEDPAYIEIAKSTDACNEDPEVQPVIDASSQGAHVLKIVAPEITVQDIELRWTVDLPGDLLTQNLVDIATQATGGLIGVNVADVDADLVDNTIRMRAGPCGSVTPGCQSPVPAFGVNLAPSADGALVDGNTIEVSRDADDGTVAGQEGIHVAATNYTIRDNTVRGWSQAGIAVTPDVDGDSSDEPLVEGNTLVTNPSTGILVEDVSGNAAPDLVGNVIQETANYPIELRDADDVLVEGNQVQLPLDPSGSSLLIGNGDDVTARDNEFRVFEDPVRENQPGTAVTITSIPSADADGATAEDIVLRDNFFQLAAENQLFAPQRQFALEITADVQLSVIDAVLNDWGVYTYHEVAGRVLDEGLTNEVVVSPFQFSSD